MNIRRLFTIAALSTATAASLAAQDSTARRSTLRGVLSIDDLVVRTFTLKYMEPGDAAKLVTPYVDYTPGGGVYSAGSVRGITVRGSAAVVARADSLLKANDREPASVRLSLQVIAAYDSAVHDTSVAGVERELHRMLRYAGYRLLATGTMSAGEGPSSTSLSSGMVQVFPISMGIERIDPVGGTVRLHVSMYGSAFSAGSGSTPVLSTGLTLPFGQSVVVGTGAPLRIPMGGNIAELQGQQALILIIRAEPAK